MLAAPEQIASVTHLAQQEAETPLWRRAARYPRNDGSLLSVVRAAAGPDRDDGRRRRATGCASPSGSASRRSTCPSRKASATSSKASGGWRRRLGRPEAGTALLDRMNALIRSAPAARGATRSGSAAAAAPSPRPGSRRNGWRLPGCGSGALQGDRVSLETLLVRPPAILLRSDYRQGQYSAGQRWLAHPLARALRRGRGRSRPTGGAGPAWGRC